MAFPGTRVQQCAESSENDRRRHDYAWRVLEEVDFYLVALLMKGCYLGPTGAPFAELLLSLGFVLLLSLSPGLFG